MGINVQSCCHRCRVKRFHFRGEERDSLIAFYKRHEPCLRANRHNVETLEDQYQEADWMRDNGGYPEEAA